jgi:pyruvate dehydrogenase E2 component (dihydrolipoamide acetyltransferase)
MNVQITLNLPLDQAATLLRQLGGTATMAVAPAAAPSPAPAAAPLAIEPPVKRGPGRPPKPKVELVTPAAAPGPLPAPVAPPPAPTGTSDGDAAAKAALQARAVKLAQVHGTKTIRGLLEPFTGVGARIVDMPAENMAKANAALDALENGAQEDAAEDEL